MRIAFALLFSLIAGAATNSAQADPYRWCAVYSGGGESGGGTNCYFITLEQCRATISGMGGFCEPNQFYDGRPVTVPGESVERGKKRAPR
jgi:hypothetical protein